ncbi:alpha/beta hydrolase [Paenibacillus sp. N1-5-1-14]|uniref:alpha/beta hydrolase n=1 Tax=Paenibacillus radicibacter TaxID=2972488 RepID=UPI0021593974|nr:alpha/beta hydrolase [Paenibacillus radicibacter]MCR8643755.1 alpha/beta hydrolase [Paenibacillus radicibacter]
MKITLITSLVVVIVIVVGLGFIGNYFYNLALNPKAERPFLKNNPDLSRAMPTMKLEDQEVQEGKLAKIWIETAPHNQVTLTSYDGLKLQGYEYMQERSTDRWVVVAHGYSGYGKQMAQSTKKFFDQGYNVLLVDLRGHGESEGDYIGMGWHDRFDMMGWINQIVEKDPQSQIMLYGVSMGGATVMMTSGENLPGNVKVIVEDCGYTSAYDEFAYQLNRLFKLPPFPIMTASNLVAEYRAGYDMKEASALEQVKKSKTPMLFIHGDQDTFVPYEMVHELYQAASVDKDLLIVEGAGHGGAHLAGAVYWNKIWDFTNKYMK